MCMKLDGCPYQLFYMSKTFIPHKNGVDNSCHRLSPAGKDFCVSHLRLVPSALLISLTNVWGGWIRAWQRQQHRRGWSPFMDNGLMKLFDQLSDFFVICWHWWYTLRFRSYLGNFTILIPYKKSVFYIIAYSSCVFCMSFFQKSCILLFSNIASTFFIILQTLFSHFLCSAISFNLSICRKTL